MIIWWLLLLFYAPLMASCGKSVKERRDKEKLKKAARENKNKENERENDEDKTCEQRSPRRKYYHENRRHASIDPIDARTGTGSGTFIPVMGDLPYDQTQKLQEGFKTAPLLPHFLPPSSIPEESTDKDLFCCKDHMPKSLQDVGYLFDLFAN